jgi:alkylated DNA repair dioxygenase AlkB
MGVSFGASRQLEFKHEESNSIFSFPQNNGDVFAFDSEVNKLFMHGVPKSKKKCDARISVIAWGQRKKNN